MNNALLLKIAPLSGIAAVVVWQICSRSAWPALLVRRELHRC